MIGVVCREVGRAASEYPNGAPWWFRAVQLGIGGTRSGGAKGRYLSKSQTPPVVAVRTDSLHRQRVCTGRLIVRGLSVSTWVEAPAPGQSATRGRGWRLPEDDEQNDQRGHLAE